jgi:hypothetical protein
MTKGRKNRFFFKLGIKETINFPVTLLQVVHHPNQKKKNLPCTELKKQ